MGEHEVKSWEGSVRPRARLPRPAGFCLLSLLRLFCNLASLLLFRPESLLPRSVEQLINSTIFAA